MNNILSQADPRFKGSWFKHSWVIMTEIACLWWLVLWLDLPHRRNALLAWRLWSVPTVQCVTCPVHGAEWTDVNEILFKLYPWVSQNSPTVQSVKCHSSQTGHQSKYRQQMSKYFMSSEKRNVINIILYPVSTVHTSIWPFVQAADFCQTVRIDL